MSEMTAWPRQLTGKCLCDRVEYQVADEFEYAMNCHCSQCRRSTGSAFKPLAGIERGKFSFRRGEELTFKYGDKVGHDVRCNFCGSLLYSLVREGQYVHIAMGTLIDAPSIKPGMHIFVGSKAPWFEITDDLPQFENLPDS